MNPNTLLNELDDLESELESVRKDQQRDDVHLTNAEIVRQRETIEYLWQVDVAIERIREYLSLR